MSAQRKLQSSLPASHTWDTGMSGILSLMSLGTAWGRTAGVGSGEEEREGKRKDNIHAHMAQGIPKP